jgi:hypothetical protein
VLLNVVRLRLRRPIREKPNIWLPFAALATKPGEKTGLAVFSHFGVLDVLSSTTPRPSDRKPHWARHLADLATKAGEKCGLISDLELKRYIRATLFELDHETPASGLHTTGDLEDQRARAQLEGADGDFVVGKPSERAPEKPPVAGRLTWIVPADYGQRSEGLLDRQTDRAIVLPELLLTDEGEATTVGGENRDI